MYREQSGINLIQTIGHQENANLEDLKDAFSGFKPVSFHLFRMQFQKKEVPLQNKRDTHKP